MKRLKQKFHCFLPFEFFCQTLSSIKVTLDQILVQSQQETNNNNFHGLYSSVYFTIFEQAYVQRTGMW